MFEILIISIDSDIGVEIVAEVVYDNTPIVWIFSRKGIYSIEIIDTHKKIPLDEFLLAIETAQKRLG